MKKTKLLILDFDDIKNPLLGAGQAHATVEVGKRLAQTGYEITVLCSRYPDYEDRVENGMKYVHIGIGSKNIRLNNLVYILTVPFMLRRYSADLILECFTAPISTLCSQLFTKTPVVGLTTSFEAERFSKLYKFPFARVQNWGLRSYRHIVAYTKSLEAKIHAQNPDVDVSIIPEGVSDEYFTIPRKNPKHILFLGRFDMGQKGIDLLLSAYARVKEQIPFPLVMAGYGPDEHKIKKMVNDLGIADRVQFVGGAFGDKKRALFSESVFVAFPSRHEGFSLFSLEALAAGQGLVGFDIPGLSWAGSDVCLKAPLGDIDTYAKNLVRASDVKFAEKMGDTARTFARQYTWEHVVSLFHKLFQNILKKKRS